MHAMGRLAFCIIPWALLQIKGIDAVSIQFEVAFSGQAAVGKKGVRLRPEETTERKKFSISASNHSEYIELESGSRGAASPDVFQSACSQDWIQKAKLKWIDKGASAIDDTKNWSKLEFISMYSYLAQSDDVAWHAPPGDVDAKDVGVLEQHGKCLAEVLYRSPKPAVYFVERQYLRAFVDKLLQMSATVPFVLLAMNGDLPLEEADQVEILKLPGLRACYASNLAALGTATLRSKKFYPMPLGLPYHVHQIVGSDSLEHDALQLGQPSFLFKSSGRQADSTKAMQAYYEPLVEHVRSSAPAWSTRIRRLLLPAASNDHALRKEYLRVLSKPEYADLVDIDPGFAAFGVIHSFDMTGNRSHKDQPMGIAAYLKSISRYQAVLSVPGAGYDCFRTWEALAVGTVPMVRRNSSFDQRLYKQMGAQYMPSPTNLTPQKLRRILDHLPDPAPYAYKLNVHYWVKEWHSHL